MLAKVRTPHSAEFATPASPSFTVTYTPNPEPSASSKFTFTNPDGSAAGNYVLVDAGTTISVKLAAGAT